MALAVVTILALVSEAVMVALEVVLVALALEEAMAVLAALALEEAMVVLVLVADMVALALEEVTAALVLAADMVALDLEEDTVALEAMEALLVAVSATGWVASAALAAG